MDNSTRHGIFYTVGGICLGLGFFFAPFFVIAWICFTPLGRWFAVILGFFILLGMAHDYIYPPKQKEELHWYIHNGCEETDSCYKDDQPIGNSYNSYNRYRR